MHIGVVVDNLSYGGGEKFLRNLIKERISAGDHISLYTWNKDWLDDELASSCSVFVISTPCTGVVNRIISIFSVIKILRSDKPNCVLAFNLNLSEIFSVACALSRVYFVFSERVDPRYIPAAGAHRVLRWMVYALASRIVFQTEVVRSLFPYFSEKSLVIPNAIDRAIEGYAGERIPCGGRVVSVGRLSDEKDFKTLIDAFSSCARGNYTLSIFGDGGLRNELDELISSLNMESCIFLRGHSENIYDELWTADIFVLPSKHEGMPNALLEAMALGVACIATDVPSGAVREIMSGQDNGFMVPVGNRNAMISALNALIENDALRAGMAKSAKSIFEKHSFNVIDVLWKKLFSSFSSLERVG